VINIGMSLFLGVVYTQLGLRQAWTWAILAGILTYVPYIGPVIAGIPAVIDGFVGPGGLATALAIIAIYLVVLLVEGYIVFPLVIGRHMELNATTVLLACLFWWVVWGDIGLFLALPLMAGIKAICHNVPGWSPWANLMGTELDGPAAIGWLSRAVARLFPKFERGGHALEQGTLVDTSSPSPPQGAQADVTARVDGPLAAEPIRSQEPLPQERT
jgi:AI-2E family transporter